ncbi:MAG TPA: hypothetical protein VE868_01695 [Balneolaceae bacterium]|nr:hypothetical protein [Balneolaceae bacterium]
MKKWLPILLLVWIFSSTCQLYAQTYTAPAGSLSEAGLMRPIHLVQQNVRWYSASTDLFTYWVDNGLYGFYGPQPKIFVDGIPVDANFFGWQDLNMLPISQTRRGTYSLNAQIHEGIIAPAGYINFKNPKVKRGISVHASHFMGIETGDPGPYKYDSLKITPNIDRWGPDDQFSLSYRKGNWYTKAIYLRRHYNPTDLPLNARLHITSSMLGTNNHYVNHVLVTQTRSGLFETGYDEKNWGMRARAAYGDSKDYVFLQPFGREVPAKTSYKQLAFTAYYKTIHWKFNGRYIEHQKFITKRFKQTPYIFDWKQRAPTVSLSAGYHSAKLKIKPGLSYQRLHTYAPGLNNQTNNLFTVSLNTTIPINERTKLKGQLNADVNGSRMAKTLRINFPLQLEKHWKLIPGFSHRELLPIRQESFSYWVNRGYTFADSLHIPYQSSVAIRKERLNVFNIQNNISITPDISFKLDTRLIHHLSLNIPFQQVRPNEYRTDTKPGPFSVTQEAGTRFGLVGQISQSISGLLQQSLAVNYSHTISGSRRYKNYFRQLPQTKIQYRMDINPGSNLTLSMNAIYRTSTKWNEFKAIEGNHYRLPVGIPIRHVGGTFHTRTPSYANITLSAQKWFWNRHVSVQIAVRNLLNDQIRMHPLGDKYATMFQLKIGVNI